MRAANLVKILVPRFRALDVEMRRRDGYYALPKAQRDAARLELLNSRWSEALGGSPYYSTLAGERDLPPSFESLEHFSQLVPMTEKECVRKNPEAFPLAKHGRGRWWLTGGSTGTPLRVFWSRDGYIQSLRDEYWARTWWGVQPFDRQAMLWGHSHTFGRGLKAILQRFQVPLIDRLRNRRRFSAYKLDPQSLRRCYDVMRRTRPISLYAYASAAFQLALANQDRDPLPHPPKAAFLASEPITQSCRETIRRVFQCPAVGEYGSIECGMIAYEHPQGGYRVFEQGVLVETQRRPEGFAILVTQLRPSGFPLFRYEIGDVSSHPLDSGDNGREIFTDIRGRSHDILRSPTGDVCHAEILTHILERVPGVAMFTAVQRKDYSLDISVQGAPITGPDERWAVSEIAKALGGVAVRVRTVEQLQHTGAGKLRWITSEL